MPRRSTVPAAGCPPRAAAEAPLWQQDGEIEQGATNPRAHLQQQIARQDHSFLLHQHNRRVRGRPFPSRECDRMASRDKDRDSFFGAKDRPQTQIQATHANGKYIQCSPTEQESEPWPHWQLTVAKRANRDDWRDICNGNDTEAATNDRLSTDGGPKLTGSRESQNRRGTEDQLLDHAAFSACVSRVHGHRAGRWARRPCSGKRSARSRLAVPRCVRCRQTPSCCA